MGTLPLLPAARIPATSEVMGFRVWGTGEAGRPYPVPVQVTWAFWDTIFSLPVLMFLRSLSPQLWLWSWHLTRSLFKGPLYRPVFFLPYPVSLPFLTGLLEEPSIHPFLFSSSHKALGLFYMILFSLIFMIYMILFWGDKLSWKSDFQHLLSSSPVLHARWEHSED